MYASDSSLVKDVERPYRTWPKLLAVPGSTMGHADQEGEAAARVFEVEQEMASMGQHFVDPSSSSEGQVQR